MATRPAYVYNGSGWDDIGDKRLLTHDHSGGADGTNIPQSSVTDLTSDLASKLDLAGGKILQIVRATDSTDRSTTSSTFVDASISVTITPQKSDSAILLIYASRISVIHSGVTVNNRARFQITDNSNNPISGSEDTNFGLIAATTSNTSVLNTGIVLFGYATPATTSATTYKVRFCRQDTNVTVSIRNTISTGQLYAIEVSA